MRARAVGVCLGLALGIMSAITAEAQVSVTPSGPTALYVTDTQSTYTATVTTNYSFWFHLFILKNGTQVGAGCWYIVQSGPSYNFQATLQTSSWGLAVGADFNYRGRAMLSATYGTQTDWHVTCTNPSTMAPPAGNSYLAAEALPPDRRGWYVEEEREESGVVA